MVIYVDHGDGQYIYTADGKKLLDFHNNFSSSPVGHNHPKVSAALLEQIPKGFSFGNPVRIEQELARILCDRVDALERVVFLCSASEACMAAARYARAFTGKNRIAKFEGGYHGLGDDFMVSTHPVPPSSGPSSHPLACPNTQGIPSRVLNDAIVLPQNDLAACERILRENVNDIAGVIHEIQGAAGGTIVYEKDFVRGLREITRELGIVHIIDETVNLRQNYHGLHSTYGVKPDLMVLGKIIGGGLPLGAVGGRADIMALNEGARVAHSGTHHAHPLALVAGVATMQIMDEKTYERMNGQGERLKRELNDWAAKKQYPFVVIGIGSLMGVEFPDVVGREFKSVRDIIAHSNQEQMKTYVFEMVNRGIYLLDRGSMSVCEPMTDANIAEFIETSKAVLTEILRRGRNGA
jgi:glutamate-1-semialdehyde 2,1-aminomutase